MLCRYYSLKFKLVHFLRCQTNGYIGMPLQTKIILSLIYLPACCSFRSCNLKENCKDYEIVCKGIQEQWDNWKVSVVSVSTWREPWHNKKHMFSCSLGERPMASGTYMQSCLIAWIQFRGEWKSVMQISYTVRLSADIQHWWSSQLLYQPGVICWSQWNPQRQDGMDVWHNNGSFGSFPLCHTSG